MDTTQHKPDIYIVNEEKVHEITISELQDRKEFYSNYINREIWHMINGIMQHHGVGEIVLTETELSLTFAPSVFNPELLKYTKKNGLWSVSSIPYTQLDPSTFQNVEQTPIIKAVPVFHIRFDTKYEKVNKLSQMLLTPPNTPIIITDSQGVSMNLSLTHQFPLFWFEKFIMGV